MGWRDDPEAPEAPATPQALPLATRVAKRLGAIGASAAEGFGSVGGLLDPVLAGAGAVASYGTPYSRGSIGERYSNELEALRRSRSRELSEAGPIAGPLAFSVGATAPAVVAPELLAKAPAPATRAALAANASPAALAAAGVHDTALYNMAGAASQNLGRPDLAQRVAEAAQSPANLLGAAPVALGQFQPLRQAKTALQGWREARMTPEARALREEGVPLTLGQENPNTWTAKLEAASAENPWGMKPEREAAKQAWMRAQIGKATVPGEAPLPEHLSDAMAEAYRRFEPQYAAIKEQPVNRAAVLQDLLPTTVEAKPVGVDARTWNEGTKEVQNALSVLGPTGPQNVGDLMSARQVLREDLRGAIAARDYAKQRILSNAESRITANIEGSLTPEQSAALQDTDRRYWNLMRTEGAMPSGRQEFTPYQMLKELERAAGRRTFKQGGAGDLQESALAAEQAFSKADLPFTGGRYGVLGSLAVPKKFTGPLAATLNALSQQVPRVPMSPVVPSPFLSRRPPEPPGPTAIYLRAVPRWAAAQEEPQ